MCYDRWTVIFTLSDRYGFSEYNSDTYGPIAYKAVLVLAGLSPDEDIRTRARIVQSLMELDHIIGSKEDRYAWKKWNRHLGRSCIETSLVFRCRICTARGRAYAEGKIEYKHYAHLWILKGVGDVEYREDRGVGFALNFLNRPDTFPNVLLQVLFCSTRCYNHLICHATVQKEDTHCFIVCGVSWANYWPSKGAREYKAGLLGELDTCPAVTGTAKD